MSDTLAFVLAALSLLATPGPTNTLLAASGAISGLRPSLKLLFGELAGYLLAIAALIVVVGPVIAAVPAFGIALRIAVCIYLVHLALQFWWRSSFALDSDQPVTLLRVFVTTLINPKAVIFAFTILPHAPSEQLSQMTPRLALLALLIVIAGSSWIALGATLRRGTHKIAEQALTFRVAAVALMLIVVMIGWNTVALAWS